MYLDLAWCEAPGAALGPMHLRALERKERLQPSGSLTGTALCGANLTRGWGVRQALSADLARPGGNPHEWRCHTCMRALARTRD